VVKFGLARASFFDREAVIKAMDRATHESLFKAAMYVRRVAKNSIKKAGKRLAKRHKESGAAGSPVSAPGSPPFDHGGGGEGPLKRLLIGAWDSSTRSSVVGPTPFDGSARASQRPRAPQALEYGGAVTATTKAGKRLSLYYQARPFMAPALEKSAAAGKIAEQFRGSLGG
jgi:hypothetical protein